MVIGSDGGDSYVVFLYDKIQWIQGTGKNPSLPDAKAQAGYGSSKRCNPRDLFLLWKYVCMYTYSLNSGNGPHFELKGSGTDQVSNIHKFVNFLNHATHQPTLLVY